MFCSSPIVGQWTLNHAEHSKYNLVVVLKPPLTPIISPLCIPFNRERCNTFSFKRLVKLTLKNAQLQAKGCLVMVQVYRGNSGSDRNPVRVWHLFEYSLSPKLEAVSAIGSRTESSISTQH
jgi:hypothetical protein